LGPWFRPKPIQLEVGGRLFVTSVETLQRCQQGSPIHACLSRGPEADGKYFLDRDGHTFEHVLHFLRDGPNKFAIPEDSVEKRRLANEADMLGVPELGDLIRNSYTGAPFPSNEAERVARLDAMRISTQPETRFDTITKALAALTNHQEVMICMIDSREQWCKSQAGEGCSEPTPPVPRNESICANTFLPEDPRQATMVVIKDLTEDQRTDAHPLTLTGDQIHHSYVGVPLVSSDGLRLGALSGLDTKPREITHAEAQLFLNFANLAAMEVERPFLSRAQRRVGAESMEKDMPEFTHGEMRRERMIEALDEVVCLIQVEQTLQEAKLLWANTAWANATGANITPPETLPGLSQVHFTWDAPEVGKRKEQFEHRGPRLSDWLSMDDAKWQSISQELQSTMDADEPWEISLPSAQLSVKRTDHSDEVKEEVVCRFVPVDLPLDVNAAAVKVVPERRSGRTGGPVGSCGWVTMMFVHAEKASRDLAGAELTRASGTPMSSSPSMRQEQLGQAPALTPFMDVRVITLLQAGDFTKAYYGLLVGCPVLVKLVERPQATKRLKGTEARDLEHENLQLQHPNLVKTYRYVEKEKHDGWASVEEEKLQTWIVQEWCELGTLETVCKTCRLNFQGEQEAMQIIYDIARAGHYLHQRGVLHGELNPGNVLLKRKLSRRGFVCKVCAVGTRRSFELEMGIDSLEDSLVYLPPELFRTDAGLTKKADVYAVGVIMFELIVGQPPFDGVSPKQIVQIVARGVGLQLPEGASGALRMLFNQLTHHDPEQRPLFADVVPRVTGIIKT